MTAADVILLCAQSQESPLMVEFSSWRQYAADANILAITQGLQYFYI